MTKRNPDHLKPDAKWLRSLHIFASAAAFWFFLVGVSEIKGCSGERGTDQGVSKKTTQPRVQDTTSYSVKPGLQEPELNSPDPHTRILALNIIESNHDRSHLELIEEMAARDPEPSIRHSAMGTLVRLGDHRAGAIFIKVLSSSRDVGDRQVAATGVVSVLPPDKAIRVLRAASADNDPLVRIRAATGLAQLGDFSGKQQLIAGTKSENGAIWRESVAGLGYVPGKESIARLQTLSSDGLQGNYIAKTALHRRAYILASPREAVEMARADVLSRYPDVVGLACQELSDLNTPESIALLFTVANDRSRDSYRVARDLLRSKGLISDSHYFDQKVTKEK